MAILIWNSLFFVVDRLPLDDNHACSLMESNDENWDLGWSALVSQIHSSLEGTQIVIGSEHMVLHILADSYLLFILLVERYFKSFEYFYFYLQ